MLLRAAQSLPGSTRKLSEAQTPPEDGMQAATGKMVPGDCASEIYLGIKVFCSLGEGSA